MLTSLEPLKPNNKWLNSTLFLKNRRKVTAFIIFAWWIDVRYQQWHHRCRSEIHWRHHYLYQRHSMQCVFLFGITLQASTCCCEDDSWMDLESSYLASMEIKIMATFFFIKYRSAGIFSWEFDWIIIK